MSIGRSRGYACLFVAAVSVTVAHAQNISGVIVGTVKDATGSAIVSAPVTITNTDTSQELKVTTSGEGEYLAPNLVPGTYTVKIEATGFQVTLVKGVTLLANRTARVDVTLNPSKLSQTVDVAAEEAGYQFRKCHDRQYIGQQDHYGGSAEWPHS